MGNDDRSKTMASSLLEQVIRHSDNHPEAVAIRFKQDTLKYRGLAEQSAMLANSLLSTGLAPGSRVAVLLPNCSESIVAALASFASGFVYVPINPLLRRRQLLHVFHNSGARILLTTKYLFAPLAQDSNLANQFDIVVLTDGTPIDFSSTFGSTAVVQTLHQFTERSSTKFNQPIPSSTKEDPAVLFYTSGSTGKAKGVLVSSRNIVDGARIVSGYLHNVNADRLLAALPLSFDYGFSQVTTALYVGAEAVLTNYTLPQALLSEVLSHKVTGLAGVPTMWSQLANTRWPEGDYSSIRYVTNTGGRMPDSVLSKLRGRLPNSTVYLMYGLTEAFRSSYLDPTMIDQKPGSIGKSIPEVELFVLNEKGALCDVDVPGELVHSGALVTMGYWNDLEATEKKFRPLPPELANSTHSKVGVWTGDIVRRDKDGFLYFQDRKDNMLKCSGYRISPTEIEDVILESELAQDVVAIGIPDSQAGQRVGIALVPGSELEDYDFAIRHICARELPPYMQPDQVLVLDKFPLNANGKPDRPAIAALFPDLTPIKTKN